MPPIVSIVGNSETGKTTLITKLIKELKSRGFHVTTIKHTAQDIAFDQPDKDSWRHIQAGSEATVLSSPGSLALIKPVTQTLTLEQVARHLGEDYDIILAEGFKQSNAPKIEVHRKKVGSPLGNINRLIAIVTDEPLDTKARQFSPDDIKGLADLLEKGFIKPQRKRTLLYVNNTPVILTAFPREVIKNTLLGMISSLKGIDKVKSVEIYLSEEKYS